MACAACAKLFRRWVGAMSEACADRHDDIVDALLGNLSGERKAEFEAHARSCAGCASELGELRSVASQLRGASVSVDAVGPHETPPPSLRAGITDAIERAQAEDSNIVPLESRRRRTRRVTVAAVA